MPAWGFGMPPPGFMDLINRKYAIQQQDATARTTEANANANFTNVRAGLLPAQSAADIAETKARTAGQNITNQFMPQTLRANIFDTMGRGLQSRALAGYENAQATTQNMGNMSPTGYNLGVLGMGGGARGFGAYGGGLTDDYQ